MDFVGYPKSAFCQLALQPGRVDKGKVILKPQHGWEIARTNGLVRLTGQLKDCGKCAADAHKRHGVLKTAIHSGVFKDQCCVNQLHRFTFHSLCSQVHAMQLKIAGRRIPLSDFL
jgi:hypothetical protein